jgi:hypothetical protein
MVLESAARAAAEAGAEALKPTLDSAVKAFRQDADRIQADGMKKVQEKMDQETKQMKHLVLQGIFILAAAIIAASVIMAFVGMSSAPPLGGGSGGITLGPLRFEVPSTLSALAGDQNFDGEVNGDEARRWIWAISPVASALFAAMASTVSWRLGRTRATRKAGVAAAAAAAEAAEAAAALRPPSPPLPDFGAWSSRAKCKVQISKAATVSIFVPGVPGAGNDDAAFTVTWRFWSNDSDVKFSYAAGAAGEVDTLAPGKAQALPKGCDVKSSGCGGSCAAARGGVVILKWTSTAWTTSSLDYEYRVAPRPPATARPSSL